MSVFLFCLCFLSSHYELCMNSMPPQLVSPAFYFQTLPPFGSIVLLQLAVPERKGNISNPLCPATSMKLQPIITHWEEEHWGIWIFSWRQGLKQTPIKDWSRVYTCLCWENKGYGGGASSLSVSNTHDCDVSDVPQNVYLVWHQILVSVKHVEWSIGENISF